MKKSLITIIIVGITIGILFSGCIGQKSIKIGDNISVEYTGSLINGDIFDTSIESVAKQHNLSRIEFQPFRFTVGKGQAIEGLDEGIIGMKVGESKKLTIPPEKAYGPKNPQLIQTIPIIQYIPTTRSFPNIFEMPVIQFEKIFGSDNKVGDNVSIPDTNINLTVKNITSSNVSLSYNLVVGYKILQSRVPWNETVIKIDNKNITTKIDVKKNDIIQFQGAPWNTVIFDIDTNNITLKHDSIPDTKIQTPDGPIKVHFNETYIAVDRNNELAGETLIFDITVKSID